MLNFIKTSLLNFLFLFVCFFIGLYFKPESIQLSLELSVPEQYKEKQLVELFYNKKNEPFNGSRRFSYWYKDYPNKIVILNAQLPNIQNLQKIRLDPLLNKGQITLRKIWITVGFTKQEIPLSLLFHSGQIYAIRNIADLSLINNELVIKTQGEDPYLVIIKNIQPFIHPIDIWKKNALLSVIFAILSLLFLVLYRFLITKWHFLSHAPKKLLLIDIQHPQKTILFSLIFLSLSILATKTFTSLVAHFHFKRTLNFADYTFTYVTDLGIATLLSIIAITIAILAQLLDSERVQHFLILCLKFLLQFIKNILNIGLIFISIGLIGLAIYYFTSAYIFYEWGGFVEYQHLKMMMHAEVDTEVTDLLFRWRTLFFLLAGLVILFISAKLSLFLKGKIHLKMIRLLVILFLPLAILAWYPMHSFQFKPSVQSPVLMLQNQKNTNAVPYSLLESIQADQFQIPKLQPIPAQYQSYQGIAKGMNLIIVMMESVRQQNLDLYGYHRKTMSTVTKLAQNSLVFHNAFVNQPRSSKTMESFSLGIYPDPRLEAISWKHKRLKVTDSLFKRFVDQGYRFYYGTMQKQKTTEGFYPFLKKISGDHLDYITDLTDIRLKNPNTAAFPKEQILDEDLLAWSATQNTPYIAFMWTQCAHMPYNSPITPFGTATKIDKYDNCLANLDESIAVLVKGLKAQGKLENTVIMIAGDHGEALGEHLDWGHGNYLYDHSLRYPALFYNPKLFKQQTDLYQRFQFKDFSATLLYLFGLPNPDSLGQSINIFRKTATDPIYLSNVYLDYKLGLIFSHFKFVYRPKYNITYLYDLTKDPQENNNIIQTKTSVEVEALKKKVLQWYQYQVNYIYEHILEF